MTEDNQQTVSLSALALSKIREENDQVAEAMDRQDERIESLQEEKAQLEADTESLEEEVDELQAEVDEEFDAHSEEVEEVEAHYEERIDDLEEEIEIKDELLADVREAERNDALDRLKNAYAAVNGVEPDEVDVEEHFGEFAEADPDQIRATARMVEDTASKTASTGVGSDPETIEQPDEPETTDAAGLDQERKMEIAEEMGLKTQLEEAENVSPQGFVVGGGD